jgi:hypothetical protein
MDLTFSFRRTLMGRLVGAAALVAPPVLMAATGCGPTGGTGGSSSQPIERCIVWPPPQGTGGAGGAGGGAGGGTGGAEPDGGAPACPASGDALPFIQQQEMGVQGCGGEVVMSGPTIKNGQCCYQVQEIACGEVGRPFLVDGRALAATARPDHRDGWSAPGALVPRTDDLSAEVRERLAVAWGRDGLFEHASVASFGRFALELLAAGAPADLIEEAHRAALDEVRHARLCLGLAGAYAGGAVAPAPFPFDGRVEVSPDLADIAARAAREGCIGETLAAVQAAEQLARATDPAVRAALAIIAADEARHAELAFRAVAWALREGGAGVRAAVQAALDEGIRAAASEAGDDCVDAAMIAHGRLDAETRRRAVTRALDEVVRPSTEAMLAPAATASGPRVHGSEIRA